VKTFLIALASVVQSAGLFAQATGPTPNPSSPSAGLVRKPVVEFSGSRMEAVALLGELPLVQKRAPAFSSWVVTAGAQPATISGGPQNPRPENPPAQSGDPKPTASSFTITKTGKIYHVVYADAQGQTWNLWSTGGIVAHVPPGGGDAGFIAPPPTPYQKSPLYVNFPNTDFEGFDWIAPENFRGSKDFMGQPCLVFSATVTEVSPESDSSGAAVKTSENRTAYVAAESRLPVAVINSNGLTTFRFLPTPTAMQSLPASMLKVINKQLDAEKALARRPGRPY